MAAANDTAAALAARWVRAAIRELSAYHVPDARGMVKLDAMENPYVWPDELRAEWLERLRAVDLNRYPDPQAAALKERLRAALGLPADAALLLGNGSDEIIQMIALALAGPDRCVLAPEPGFVMFRMIALFAGMRYVGVPLREVDFALDADAVIEAIETHDPAVIFLAYPNNPTGNLFERGAIERIAANARGLVVIDEAYEPFAESSCLDLVGRFPNVVVMRTLSKLGLAGLRLGLLVGDAAWLDEFEKVRLPYNINVLTQASAEFALRHHAVLDAQTARIRADRDSLAAELARIPGLRVFPSRANFILVRTPGGRAGEIFDGLKRCGILVKNLAAAGGPLADCLRLTVGTPGENRLLLEALRAELKR